MGHEDQKGASLNLQSGPYHATRASTRSAQPSRISLDHGLTGTDLVSPALAAARESGDKFIVFKLDGLARSICEARNIAGEMAERGVTLGLGHSAYNPTDPMGRIMFNMLSTFAEFDVDLIKIWTP